MSSFRAIFCVCRCVWGEGGGSVRLSSKYCGIWVIHTGFAGGSPASDADPAAAADPALSAGPAAASGGPGVPCGAAVATPASVTAPASAADPAAASGGPGVQPGAAVAGTAADAAPASSAAPAPANDGNVAPSAAAVAGTATADATAAAAAGHSDASVTAVAAACQPVSKCRKGTDERTTVKPGAHNTTNVLPGQMFPESPEQKSKRMQTFMGPSRLPVSFRHWRMAVIAAARHVLFSHRAKRRRRPHLRGCVIETCAKRRSRRQSRPWR